MKQLLRPRVWLSLLAGLAVGAVLYMLPLERPRRVLACPAAIWGLYYAPDSSRLATVHISTDPNVAPEKRGTARLWNAETGELIAVLEEQSELLASCVFSPDSRSVASSNEKGDIKLWDADTGWPLGVYRMKDWQQWQSAASLVFSAEGRLLTVDPSGRKLWDAETGKEAGDIAAAVGETHWATYGGGSGFYLGGDNDTIRVIHLTTGKRVAEFPLPEAGRMLRHTALTPDGQTLVAHVGPRPMPHQDTFMIRGPAFVWDRSGSIPRAFPEADAADDCVVSADGASLVCHFAVAPERWIDWLLRRGNDPRHAIRVFDLATGRETGVVYGGLKARTAPDGRTLAIGCQGGDVELWDFPLRKAWLMIVSGGAVATGLAWLVLGWLLGRWRARSASKVKPMPVVRASLVIGLTILAVGDGFAQATPPTGKAGGRVDRFGDPLPPGALMRIGTTRLRLPRLLQAIAISPDGKLVAAIGDRMLGVWDTADGRELFRHHPEVHDSSFFDDAGTWLRFAPNGRALTFNCNGGQRMLPLTTQTPDTTFGPYALCGSFTPDGKHTTVVFPANDVKSLYTVRHCDTATGKAVKEWTIPRDPSIQRDKDALPYGASPCLSPDGTMLATLETDRAARKQLVRLHDVVSGAEVRRWTVENPMMRDLTFSPDGRLLAAVGADIVVAYRTTACIWDVATGKEKARWKINGRIGSGAFGLAFAPDGASVFCTESGGLARWDWQSAKRLQLYPEAGGPIAFFPDGKTMAVQGSFGAMRLLDVETGKDRYALPNAAHHVALSADGRLVAWGDGSAIVIADTATGKDVARWTGHVRYVERLAFAPDGKTLASSGTDGRIRLWEPPGGRPLHSLPTVGGRAAMHFSADGRRFGVSGYGEVRVWDTITGQRIAAWKSKQEPALARNLAAAALPDSDGRVLRLHDPATGTLLHKLAGYRSHVIYDVDLHAKGLRYNSEIQPVFTPDGRWLLMGGESMADHERGVFHLWDVKAGKRLPLVLRGQEVMLDRVTFSPDGSRLAAMRSDGTISILQISTGATVRSMAKASDRFSAHPVFSADGRMLITSVRGMLQFFEVATGQEICRHEPSLDRDYVLNVESAGRVLAATSHDGTTVLWDLTRLATDDRPRGAPLTANALPNVWDALANTDAKAGRRAVETLIAAPAQALPLLRERLKPVPSPDAKQLADWIAGLGSDDFERRAEAERELERVVELAGPALRKAHAAKVPLEARRRIESLLAKLEPTTLPTGESLRAIRAVEVLEGVGSPEVIRLLQELSKGAVGARLTDEAIGTLSRLKDR